MILRAAIPVPLVAVGNDAGLHFLEHEKSGISAKPTIIQCPKMNAHSLLPGKLAFDIYYRTQACHDSQISR